MRRFSRRQVEETGLTTAVRRTRRSERGDTLVEVLISLVVLGTASVALLIAFSTSIAASGVHRNVTVYDTVLATASQEAIAAIDNNPLLFSSACSTPISSYPGEPSGFALPAPYAGKYTVTYVATNPIQYWNGSQFQAQQCYNNQPQLITIGIVGTSYTNSFVVQFPIAIANNNSSDPAQALIFLQSPIGGYAGSSFSQQPIVEIANSGGAVSTDLSPVILTLTDSTGAPLASGSGTVGACQGNEILGVVTFTGCAASTGGTFTLTATDGTLTPAVSAPFTITATSFYLGFYAQPAGGKSGTPFSTAPIVRVYNQSNNSWNQTWSGSIALTLSGGALTNCSGSTTTSITLSTTNGQVTMPPTCDFSGGYFYNPNSSPQITATQYTIAAVVSPPNGSNAAIPALSNSFSVSSFGAASQLVFSTEPTGVASLSATTAFTGQPVVTVEDAYGNVVTSAANTVSLAISPGSTNESLTGCNVPTPNKGNYAFTGCHGSSYDTGLNLTATSSGLTTATSTNFNITGPASQLLFKTSPVAGVSGSSFSVQPVLVFEDSGNRVVTSTSSVVSFSVSPASGTLSTCTGLAPNLGYVNVANCTFTGLVGTPYTLTASAGGLTSLPSTAFSPTSPGVASQLAFTTQPVAGAAGAVLTTQPVLKVEDVAGNVVSSSTASISLAASPGVLSYCAGLTASAGVVNVSNCTFGGVVGTPYTMTASSSNLTSAVSTNFTPTGAGAMSQITLSGCPSSITVTTNCSVTATLEDTYGNIETLDSSSVVTFTPLTGIGSLTGFTSATFSNGKAFIVLTAASAGPVTFDASSVSVTSSAYSMTVNAAPSITTTSLAAATRGQIGYSQTLAGAAGTTPYTWSISSGTLPTGLTLNAATGAITGTVNAAATSQTFTVTLTDADLVTATKSLTITVNVPPSITTTSLATATQNETGYSQALVGTSGTTPYTWSISSGTLPTGLTLNAATGAITGTVNAAATSQTFTVKLTDANGVSATKSLTITVNAAPSISPNSLPGATRTGAYSQTLTASGGTIPFGNWSISSGTLPTGLTLNAATGAITGTVNAAATSQTFTVQITDANGVAATRTYTLTVNAGPSITTTSLATATDGQTGYSQTLVGTSGTTPYTWSISSGTLPTGLSLNSSTGAITGTVNAAATSQTFTVTLTDVDLVTATKSLTITVNAAPSISTSSLVSATQNQTGYSQTLAGSGGTAPDTWSISSGTLPTGLTLNAATGAITGTVGGAATTQTFTVSLTDANAVSATKSLTITVNPSPTITTNSLAAATEGQAAYSQTLNASGGTGSYTWSISAGTLPAGLNLNGSTGAITGAVSASATSQSVTFKVTDANAVTAAKTIIMAVNAPPSITTNSLPGATMTGTYNQTILESGGTTPFTWTISSGALPAGLSINAATGAITGTVSNTATSQTFTVTLSDANAVVATKSLTITVNAVPSVTTASLATATQTETGYSQTLAGSGGTTPYLWSITSGTLPAGMSLNAGTGAITGTPSNTATSQTFTVTLSDFDNVTATKSLTIIVNAVLNISTISLPGGTKNGAYNQTVSATGGTTPITWSVTTGSLPTGLTINSATGAITGTVSNTATSQTFTVTVTDTNGVTAAKSFTITVNSAPSISTTSLAGATQGQTGYSQTLVGTAGTTPYAWSITSGILPAGLTINSATGAITGTVSGSAISETFSVTLTDANNVTATKSLSITVAAAPTITTTSLPGGSKLTTYIGATLQATGGTGSYTWSISSGILPANLSLNSATGAISGNVKNSAVSETFTVTVTDANGVSASKSLTITVT